MPEVIRLRVKRQDQPGSRPYWEEFAIPYRPQHNVVSLLMALRENPVNAQGKRVAPVVFEANCMEEVCGSCTMIINGRVKQACSTLIDTLTQPITLEPMTKFPLVRDLCVDRQRLFDDLKRAKCWVPIDGTFDLGPGPAISQKDHEERYPLSRCISCGCCLEACPRYTPTNNYLGAAIFNQVRLFNLHPLGAALKDDRLRVMMGSGGIAGCSKAGNCVHVCPKDIPNLESIATIGRQTTLYAIRHFFSG